VLLRPGDRVGCYGPVIGAAAATRWPGRGPIPHPGM